MNKKLLIWLAALVLICVFCFMAFDNGKKEVDEAPVRPSAGSNRTNTTTIEIEEDEIQEEVVEVEEEIAADVRTEAAAEEFIEEPEEIQEFETETPGMVSLSSFDRPYNHTVTEEAFLMMSPEDQRAVIDEVVADAGELKMGILGCYPEVQELIKAEDYSTAVERVMDVLEPSIEYNGGDESLVLCQIMSLNSQNDLLGIMNLIHHATGNI
jgi:hypothetical protein